MGLMDFNEGAEYSEEELFGDKVEVKNMNEKCTAVLETNDNNGSRAVTDFSYDKNQIAAVLEYCAEGLREGEIVIKENKPFSPVVTHQDASVQANATVDNSEADAKRQPYRLKAEITAVNLRITKSASKKYVEWTMKPLDPESTFPEYTQKTWIKDNESNFFVENNLKACEYPSSPLPDFNDPTVIQELVGKIVMVEEVLDNKFSNSKIIAAA